MGSVVLAGATSGSTTITPSDTVTVTVTLPSTGGTLQTSGAGFTTNGVAYASSTSALTTGSALTFDGTNFGVGASGSYRLNIQTTASGNIARFSDGTAQTLIVGTSSTGLYYNNANSGYQAWQIGGTEGMRLASTGLTVTGNVIGTNGFLKASGSATFSAAAVGEAIFGPDSGVGGLLYGRGSTYDMTIGNRGTNVALGVTANTINLVAPGNLAVTGSVSKGSGSFRIDHPLTSLTETHHLVHSFIEGPQADLIYRGKVTLVNGLSTVNIDTVSSMTDGTFVILCRDVQCFTTNESDWTPVKGSVSGNILTIEAQDNTSTANISWMVIGERQDKHIHDTDWTDENGKVIVEPLKTAQSATIQSLTERITALEGART